MIANIDENSICVCACFNVIFCYHGNQTDICLRISSTFKLKEHMLQ
jgi:hypothetical protein